MSFHLVDSEVGATVQRDAEAARARALPPIILDAGGKLADALARSAPPTA